MSMNFIFPKRMPFLRWLLVIVAFYSSSWAQGAQIHERVVEILADHGSRFRMEGQNQPVLKLKAGERVTLRITARKAKNVNRDGAIHGFTLLYAKDRSPVAGWDFELNPGVQEFNVKAPSEPGDYIVVCTVVCSEEHEGMNMKVVVLP